MLPTVCEVLSTVCEVLPGVCEVLPAVCEALPAVCEVLPALCEALPAVCDIFIVKDESLNVRHLWQSLLPKVEPYSVIQNDINTHKVRQ